MREQVYDIAWSGDRERGEDGKVPAVGSTINDVNASNSNSIDSAFLQAF